MGWDGHGYEPHVHVVNKQMENGARASSTFQLMGWDGHGYGPQVTNRRQTVQPLVLVGGTHSNTAPTSPRRNGSCAAWTEPPAAIASLAPRGAARLNVLSAMRPAAAASNAAAMNSIPMGIAGCTP
eukprot:scaffold1002_cov117-Isochrysis_galbana.AAC.13